MDEKEQKKSKRILTVLAISGVSLYFGGIALAVLPNVLTLEGTYLYLLLPISVGSIILGILLLLGLVITIE